MADVSNERGVSETMDLVDATGHKLNQATQQGVSETIDRAETTGRRLSEATQRNVSETIDRAEATGHILNQAAEETFDDMLRAYQTFCTFRGTRRIAEAYIDMNARMAKESLDFSRRFSELWFDGVRKLWQATEEGRREITNGA
jgi:cell division septum initiation protein DivIVA